MAISMTATKTSIAIALWTQSVNTTNCTRLESKGNSGGLTRELAKKGHGSLAMAVMTDYLRPCD